MKKSSIGEIAMPEREETEGCASILLMRVCVACGDAEEGFHIVIKPKLPAQLFPVWPLKRSTPRASERASRSAASRRTCHVQLVFPSCLASLESRESVTHKMLH